MTDRYPIRWSTDLNETGRWLRDAGYKGAPAAAPGCTFMGFVFYRDGEPLQMVMLGETLVFDGDRVTVEAA
ncbi:hypothetical protein [Streptomyces canus]|uniref:hypothetical protein n=1 Tax=Streptomyces canus TaxID=58343 RepID=UPI003867BE05|nr:hypothetical protein OH824_34965 [Streptomyces canus]